MRRPSATFTSCQSLLWVLYPLTPPNGWMGLFKDAFTPRPARTLARAKQKNPSKDASNSDRTPSILLTPFVCFARVDVPSVSYVSKHHLRKDIHDQPTPSAKARVSFMRTGPLTLFVCHLQHAPSAQMPCAYTNHVGSSGLRFKALQALES